MAHNPSAVTEDQHAAVVPGVEPFAQTLSRHRLELKRARTVTLQVNVGLLCNQVCRHCHLKAGPGRTELMDRATAEEVVAFARRSRFQVIDITGGAPELNPNLPYLLEQLAPLTPRLMLRSNLTALSEPEIDDLIAVCTKHRVVIVASLPASNQSQTDSQRGKGVWEKSMVTLAKLNAGGYGKEDTGLELDVVSNPSGAFLPPAQDKAAEKFKRDLRCKQGIVFNQLFTFANAPLGRFRDWLEESGNLEPYMTRLFASFNPCTVEGLMCRTLLSVNWDGYLFDCDFNIAKGLSLGGKRHHVSEMDHPPEPGTPIATGSHCYACTAGSGFT